MRSARETKISYVLIDESNEDVRNRIKVIQNNLEYIEKDLSKYVSFEVITYADIKKHSKKHTKIDAFWLEEKLS